MWRKKTRYDLTLNVEISEKQVNKMLNMLSQRLKNPSKFPLVNLLF